MNRPYKKLQETEHRQVEAQIRQKLKETKPETDIRPESSELQTEDLPPDRPSSSLASSSRIGRLSNSK